MSQSPAKIVGRSLMWGLLGKAAVSAYKLHRRRRRRRRDARAAEGGGAR